jgi:hypothetical protein
MLEMDDSRWNVRQRAPQAGKKRARTRKNATIEKNNPALTSAFYYIMIHQDDVSLWSGRVFDDGTQLNQEMDFEQYGITDDDLRDAIRLGENDYFGSAMIADPRYYPVSPHIETKLKILNIY